MPVEPFAEGITRIRVPTPWPVGPVNVLIVEDDPLTLVDSGSRSAESVATIEAGLREAGHRLEDVERLVLTHQHIDHSGGAAELRRRSGAEVVAMRALVPWLADYEARQGADDRLARSLLRRHGADDATQAAAAEHHDHAIPFGEAVVVDRALEPGEVLEFADRAWRAEVRTGHSHCDTVFLDRERRVLLCGDHVLAKTTSKPVAGVPLDGVWPQRRPRQLADLIASLRLTREMPADVLLPGHGRPVTDHRALIDERLRAYEDGAARTLAALADGPRTAASVALEFWPRIPSGQLQFPLFEILGHLDRLIDEGAVREDVGDDDVAWFSAA